MATIPHPNTDTIRNRAMLVFSWLWVGIPLAWGVWETVHSSLAIFR